MADTSMAAPHPTMGGKSLASYKDITRQPYKSWRKKYRKLKYRFDGALDENKQLFKDELKLQSIAKRLREELDGLMELCLDLNENPSIPPELRFDVKMERHKAKQNVVPKNITPEASNSLLAEYTSLVNHGAVPHLDLHVIREQINERLAAQDVRNIDEMDQNMLRPAEFHREFTEKALFGDKWEGEEGKRLEGYMDTDQEDAFLLKENAKLGDQWSMERFTERNKNNAEDKDFADLTARELDKHVELVNPQSVHNWLKAHSKAAAAVDDNDSLASQDGKIVRKRGGKNLAKQVGEKAVERAREAASPASMSDTDWEDTYGQSSERKSSKKKGRDPDSTYRAKGGKANSSSNKAKRKRNEADDSFADLPPMEAKKPKLDTEAES